MNAIEKYRILALLTAVVSAITYIMGQPTISLVIILNAVILVVTLIVHDLEENPSMTPSEPPKV